MTQIKTKIIDYANQPNAKKCPKCGKKGYKKQYYVGEHKDILITIFDHIGELHSLGGFRFITIKESCNIEYENNEKIDWMVIYRGVDGEKRDVIIKLPRSLSDTDRLSIPFKLKNTYGIKFKKVIKWHPK